jgi:hypothetical protein
LRFARTLVLWLVLAAWLAACGANTGISTNTSPSPSPQPDAATLKYVALVHAYWASYVIARGNGATVCLDRVDPPQCRIRAAAILAVHEKFVSDLDTASPPTKFAADDQVFRRQLPKAIADVKKMISAADSGDKQAVLDATNAYVSDMIPEVTGALDHVDPSLTHD